MMYLVDSRIARCLDAVGVLDVEGDLVEYVPDEGVWRAAIQDWVLLLPTHRERAPLRKVEAVHIVGEERNAHLSRSCCLR
jgi:hypothetical protein